MCLSPCACNAAVKKIFIVPVLMHIAIKWI